jgi:hypothetical protein
MGKACYEPRLRFVTVARDADAMTRRRKDVLWTGTVIALALRLLLLARLCPGALDAATQPAGGSQGSPPATTHAATASAARRFWHARSARALNAQTYFASALSSSYEVSNRKL